MICNSCPFFTTPKRWCSTLLAGNTQVNPFPHFTKFGFWCSALLVESTLTYICSGYMCLPFWSSFQGKAHLGFHFGENTNAIGRLGKSNSSRGKRLNLIKSKLSSLPTYSYVYPIACRCGKKVEKSSQSDFL